MVRRISLFACFCLLFSPEGRAQIFADFDTSLGKFSCELLYEDAPMAVANFVGLADGTKDWIDTANREIKRGVPYYDGLTFHRVIKDFMCQGGSRNGLGNDGPGYRFIDQIARDGEGALLHDHDQQGLLSMANAGPNTNGSQFFLTDLPTPWLDGVHTVFGKIVAGPAGTLAEGIEVITAMNDVTTAVFDKPVVPLVLNSVKIRRVGEAAEAFDVHAQGLPVVSALQSTMHVTPTGDAAELRYEKAANSRVEVFASSDLMNWTSVSANFFPEAEVTGDDITATVATDDVQFYRLQKVDYSTTPHVGGPATVAGGTFDFEFTEIFEIDVTIGADGTSGTWTRPDGQGNGTLESAEYLPKADVFVDRLILNYEGLIAGSDFVFAMAFDLSFDTATTGRFRANTNGTPRTVSGTFVFVP